jgi:hypothetical protein
VELSGRQSILSEQATVFLAEERKERWTQGQLLGEYTKRTKCPQSKQAGIGGCRRCDHYRRKASCDTTGVGARVEPTSGLIATCGRRGDSNSRLSGGSGRSSQFVSGNWTTAGGPSAGVAESFVTLCSLCAQVTTTMVRTIH